MTVADLEVGPTCKFSDMQACVICHDRSPLGWNLA